MRKILPILCPVRSRWHFSSFFPHPCLVFVVILLVYFSYFFLYLFACFGLINGHSRRGGDSDEEMSYSHKMKITSVDSQLLCCVCVCARVKVCLARGHLRYFEGGGGGGCCSKSECIWSDALCTSFVNLKSRWWVLRMWILSLSEGGGGGGGQRCILAIVNENGHERPSLLRDFSSRRGCCVPPKKFFFFFFGGTQHPLVQAIGFRLLAPHGGRR